VCGQAGERKTSCSFLPLLVVKEGELRLRPPSYSSRDRARGEGRKVQEAATILAHVLGSSISTSDSLSLPPAL